MIFYLGLRDQLFASPLFISCLHLETDITTYINEKAWNFKPVLFSSKNEIWSPNGKMTIILNLSRCKFLFLNIIFAPLQHSEGIVSFEENAGHKHRFSNKCIPLKQKDHLNDKSNWYMILVKLAKNKVF